MNHMLLKVTVEIFSPYEYLVFLIVLYLRLLDLSRHRLLLFAIHY